MSLTHCDISDRNGASIKANLSERQGRKATGLRDLPMTAGLPKKRLRSSAPRLLDFPYRNFAQTRLLDIAIFYGLGEDSHDQTDAAEPGWDK